MNKVLVPRHSGGGAHVKVTRFVLTQTRVESEFLTSYLTASEQWLDKVLSGKRYQLGRESIGKCRSGIQSTRVYGNAKFFPVSDGRLQRSSFRLLTLQHVPLRISKWAYDISLPTILREGGQEG